MTNWLTRKYGRLNQSQLERRAAGDTIVEVLITIAIISMVLVAAYLLANRSRLSLEDTQEHLQATGLANQQVELLRATNGAGLTSGGCFNDQGNPVATAQCNYGFDNHSNCNPATAAFCYHVVVTFTAAPLAADAGVTTTTYNVRITWPSIFGSSGEVDMGYRLAKTNATLPGGMGGGGGAQGGGGGGAVGAPAVGTIPCTVNCGVHPNPPTYHYTISRRNTTTSIPDSQIAGCIWDWGDGRQDIDRACHGGNDISHAYAQPAVTHPYPIDCNTKSYTITLRIRLTNGQLTTGAVNQVSVANCW